MITWAERAKAAIAQMDRDGTAKTDETTDSRLLAVSSVPVEAVSTTPEQLSSVLAVPTPTILKKSADWRALAATYHAHHFTCPQCIAAGRGSAYGQRCATGMALWLAYCE
ncbi:MAG: hypothetical protein U1E84_05095 [Rhodoferax sp.]